MIYAVSDLHGCYDKYQKLLGTVKLRDEDTLYVLGDIVDRGKRGIELIKDIAARKNVIALKGNHDRTAAILLRFFGMSDRTEYSDKLKEVFDIWLSDGGEVTYRSFLLLDDAEKQFILDFLDSLRLKKALTVGNRKYFLAHTVPSKSRMIHPDRLVDSDYIIGEPEYEKIYFNDTIIVTGHTPTSFIDPKYEGRIWRGNNHIAIDCGAVFGNPLGCLCLDTLEEIYIS